MGIKVLITGGQGFIGKNLVLMLSADKRISKIIVVDSKKPNKRFMDLLDNYSYFSKPNDYKRNSKKINFIKCNTKNLQFALEITKKIDYVVHLAAESGVDISISKPYESFLTNVIGTYNYLEASRVNNVKNFIFSSSGAVFGNAVPPMKIKYHKSPISPYGSSKLTIETYCSTYSNVFGLPTTILRFSNAYGEFSAHKKSIVSKIIKSYLSNENIEIYGDGNHSRDFIYVKDICTSIVRCFRKTTLCNEYHIGTGKETTLNNLIKITDSIFQKYKIKKPMIKYSKERIGDMKNNSLDITKTKKLLNWTPLFSLKRGLDKTINWYLSNN